MRHADEGELHAHLDGALAGIAPARAAELARHLEACDDCRARLEAERRERDRATAILRGAEAPAAAIPPFETVRRRTPRRAAPRPRRAAALAWAASLLLALGVGWLARGVARGGGEVEVAVREAQAPEAASSAPRSLATPPVRESSAPAAAADAAEAPPAAGAAGAEPAPPVVRAVEEEAQRLAVRQGEAGTRDVQPREEALALDEVAATGAAAAPAAPSAALPAPPLPPAPARAARAAGAAAWRPSDRAGAEAWLGRAPLLVPGLPVLGWELGTEEGGRVVRVSQRLESGASLRLVQRAADAEEEGEAAVLRDGLLVSAEAPLPADSLRALLRRLR